MALVTLLGDDMHLEERVKYGVEQKLNVGGAWEDPFFIVDLERVLILYEKWNKALPNVTPFYAVKCNTDLVLLKLLAALGSGFDCASKEEIEQILSIGVAPSRIIYANPCKHPSYVRYAAEVNVDIHTFDCEGELLKIKKHFPHAKLVLRLECDDPAAEYPLGKKFGCTVSKSNDLLRTAKELDVAIIGVCFHIGSRSSTPATYAKAIEMSGEVFQYGKQLGFQFTLLDIGGGFPGKYNSDELFFEMTKAISESLEKHFHKYPNVKVIAEPGTYFATSPFSIAVNVIGKKVFSNPQKYSYTVSDGRYGNFTWKDQTFIFRGGSMPHTSGQMYPSTIWGPTVCATDKIADIELPELNVGDWLFFRNMGDYTVSTATSFNGFSKEFKKI